MTETPQQQPLKSLVASAQRLTSKSMTTQVGIGGKGWQDDAWEMYDLVGEERFLATVLAGRMAQARFYVGELDPDDPTSAPKQSDNATANDVLASVGGSPVGRAQLVQRLGVNLFVAGDGWVVGIPSYLLPANKDNPDVVPLEPGDPLDIEDLTWRMLSVSEVTMNSGGEVTLKLSEDREEQVIASPEQLFMVRIWRPHPRKWWEADSPTRSSLPVLRELVGLTMHISAQVDSRLAGAGLLIIPQSAARALANAAGVTEDESTDQFTEALMEAMLKPIQDRANASAVVPLVVTVPDEACDKFNFITFSKPLDTEARNLRDEALRRLALGQDAPPELLLGTAGMNHWGAWLVQEDVVTTHLEPPLALICDALTTQYLWPVLIEGGMDEEAAQQHVVWYDVSDLVVRPNHAADAKDLNERGVISDEALRGAVGFDEADAPPTDDLTTAQRLGLELVSANPSLLADPGLASVVAQIDAVLTGGTAPALPSDTDTPTEGDETPVGNPEQAPTAPNEPDLEPVAASAFPSGWEQRVHDGAVI